MNGLSVDSFCSGDDAVLKVWDILSGEEKQEINCYFHGALGAITWVDLGDGVDHAFAFGCNDGSVHVYKQDLQTVSRRCTMVYLRFTVEHSGKI